MNAPLHREVPVALLNDTLALDNASAQWDRDIVGQLTRYIEVPANLQTLPRPRRRHHEGAGARLARCALHDGRRAHEHVG